MLSLSPAVDAVAAEHFARCCDIVGLTLAYPAIERATALDGSQTAKRDGRWLADCSVPRRAAELMVRNENWTARSLCVVAPTHGQQLRVLLDRLGPTRALVVVAASQDDLADMLASVDLLADLSNGRLHCAWDEASLKAVFRRHPGLAVPQQMVRMPDTDPETAKTLIAWVQATLAPVIVEHARRLTTAVQTAPSDGTGVVAGGTFRLWNDAGNALAHTFGEVIDTHRPTLASDAALAEALAAKKIIVADRPRPGWLGGSRIWITWQTTPTMPPFNAAHASDGLVLADAAWRPAAEAAGWPAGRIAVAAWPQSDVRFMPGAIPALPFDVPSLEVPKDCEDVTNRRLVWEAIRGELTTDPFAVGDDAARYVARALPRLGLPADAEFPVDRYVHALVAPAFTVGLARWLAKQFVPFTLHGRGWQAYDGLADHWRGPIVDRSAFEAVLINAGGVIDPAVPTPSAAARSLGVPVVHAFGRTPPCVLQSIGGLRGGRLPVAAQADSIPLRAAIEQLVCSKCR